MSIAALSMYDWVETRAVIDAEWAGLADALRREGIDAPARLARCNADLPAVPGGIFHGGRCIAPDPATLPPRELDLSVLWRHPLLLVAQTCWGPMEAGLRDHVQFVGQPDYSAYEGGEGIFYSSAVLMRRGEAERSVEPPAGGSVLPVALMRGRRFAYNEPHSMSGFLALQRDLGSMGESLSVFSETIVTGSHRASALAVAEGRADICALDCRTWALVQAFEPAAAANLAVVGWTARRPGLPFITSRLTPPEHLAILRQVLRTGS